MTSANPWLLAVHLISLIVWIGGLLALSRLLSFHVKQDAALQAQLSPFERRLYRLAIMPAGALAIITGLMMLHGLGSVNFASVGDALAFHFKPRLPNGDPSPWYVTFHVKLVSATVLFLGDVWLGRQVSHLAAGRATAGWPLGAVLALAGILIGLVTTWLLFASMGLGFGRNVGYGVGLALAGVGFWFGRKLRGAARFDAMHAAIGALALLIVVLMIAKPLAFGAPL
ncbi:MAG: CopD family protein [Planctomycetes bacterium]|nr:CopD family protein [Planctomycetota bacterium]